MRPEDGKDIYDSIEIPEELSEVVNRAIGSVDKEKSRMRHKNKSSKVVRIFRYAATAAAGLLVCMTIGLNTSEAFAQEMSQVPVLRALAKVLTIRSFHGTEGDYEIDMEVPEIATEENGVETAPAPGTFTGDINAEIQKVVDDYMAQARVEFEEYKEAFFATGGTEEEWGGRTMDIHVDYKVHYQEGNYLSLELITSKAWVSSQEERHYYNINLATGQHVTLQELLGDDYINLANESIITQIKERMAADENVSYFGFGPNAEEDREMGWGFTTITEETPFYINENGNVVIVFPEYEIAAGYMGFQEFEIGKADLE